MQTEPEPEPESCPGWRTVHWDFDYTLMIDFERLSNRDLQGILQALYSGGCSECYKDIELLADEVILRMDAVKYELRYKHNRLLAELIVSTFNTLKNISKFKETSSDRIQIIHDNFKKYMYGSVSPAASPVVSPQVVKIPTIMKKPTRETVTSPDSTDEDKEQGVKLPKIIQKVKNKLG